MGKHIPQAPRDLPPDDSYSAVCIGFVDVGTQTPSNPEWSPSRKAYTVFELQGIKNKANKPYQVVAYLTYSADSRSNMVKLFAPWLGVKKGLDIDTDQMLDRAALITVQQDEEGQYANITGVAPLPKQMKVGKASVASYSLYLDETFDKDVFDGLPAKWKEKIEASPEYQELQRTSKPKKEKADKKAPAKGKAVDTKKKK